MKRHIAIPLLCVVLVAALSIPVFAAFPYPENNVSGRAVVRFWPTGATVPDPPEIYGGYQLNFGELWTGYFASGPSGSDYESYSVYTDLSFTLEIYVGGDIFIAVPYNDYIGSNITALSQYYDPSGDYSVNLGTQTVKYYIPDLNNMEYVISQTSAELNINFLHFTDVPPGNYQISCESMWEGAGVMCLGIYVSQGDVYGSIVDQFTNGSLSYTDAVDELFNYQESLTPIDNHEAMVQALELQNNLSKLNNAASTVAAAKANDLDNRMGAVVDSFASGDVTMKQAMDSLQSDFSESLSGAQTVDEAQAVMAVYKVNMQKLELQGQFQLMEGFDVIISDDDMQKMDDYYAAEEELVNSFDVAEFDSMLQLESYLLQLPADESVAYKKFFNYLLNDSPLRLFIIIPLTMGVVSILLGTKMHTRPEPVSRTTIQHSDGSRSVILKYKNE